MDCLHLMQRQYGQTAMPTETTFFDPQCLFCTISKQCHDYTHQEKLNTASQMHLHTDCQIFYLFPSCLPLPYQWWSSLNSSIVFAHLHQPTDVTTNWILQLTCPHSNPTTQHSVQHFTRPLIMQQSAVVSFDNAPCQHNYSREFHTLFMCILAQHFSPPMATMVNQLNLGQSGISTLGITYSTTHHWVKPQKPHNIIGTNSYQNPQNIPPPPSSFIQHFLSWSNAHHALLT